MATLAEVKKEWTPLCGNSLVEIPTDNPVICMEHKLTKKHAYFDVNGGRFLSQQEAFDVLRGDNSYFLRSS